MKKYIKYDPYGTDSMIEGGITGATQGASLGAAFSPLGGVIGGVGGALIGAGIGHDSGIKAAELGEASLAEAVAYNAYEASRIKTSGRTTSTVYGLGGITKSKRDVTGMRTGGTVKGPSHAKGGVNIGDGNIIEGGEFVKPLADGSKAIYRKDLGFAKKAQLLANKKAKLEKQLIGADKYKANTILKTLQGIEVEYSNLMAAQGELNGGNNGEVKTFSKGGITKPTVPPTVPPTATINSDEYAQYYDRMLNELHTDYGSNFEGDNIKFFPYGEHTRNNKSMPSGETTVVKQANGDYIMFGTSGSASNVITPNHKDYALLDSTFNSGGITPEQRYSSESWLKDNPTKNIPTNSSKPNTNTAAMPTDNPKGQPKTRNTINIANYVKEIDNLSDQTTNDGNNQYYKNVNTINDKYINDGVFYDGSSITFKRNGEYINMSIGDIQTYLDFEKDPNLTLQGWIDRDPNVFDGDNVNSPNIETEYLDAMYETGVTHTPHYDSAGNVVDFYDPMGTVSQATGKEGVYMSDYDKEDYLERNSQEDLDAIFKPTDSKVNTPIPEPDFNNTNIIPSTSTPTPTPAPAPNVPVVPPAVTPAAAPVPTSDFDFNAAVDTDINNSLGSVPLTDMAKAKPNTTPRRVVDVKTGEPIFIPDVITDTEDLNGMSVTAKPTYDKPVPIEPSIESSYKGANFDANIANALKSTDPFNWGDKEDVIKAKPAVIPAAKPAAKPAIAPVVDNGFTGPVIPEWAKVLDDKSPISIDGDLVTNAALTGISAAGNLYNNYKLSQRELPTRDQVNPLDPESFKKLNYDATLQDINNKVTAATETTMANTNNANVAAGRIGKITSGATQSASKVNQTLANERAKIYNDTVVKNKAIEGQNNQIDYLNEQDKFNLESKVASNYSAILADTVDNVKSDLEYRDKKALDDKRLGIQAQLGAEYNTNNDLLYAQGDYNTLTYDNFSAELNRMKASGNIKAIQGMEKYGKSKGWY